MSSINKKLENRLRNERWKIFVIGLLACAIIIPTLLFINSPNMGNTTKVSGVVTKLHGKPTGEGGNFLYILVKLDNGNEVKSRIDSSALYRKGKRVNLEKVEPVLFGNPTIRQSRSFAHALWDFQKAALRFSF